MNVTILLGSASDAEVAQKAEAVLRELQIPYETFVASAHRSPDRVDALVRKSKADVFIAIAGLTNALAGVVGARTLKPVIGVPVSGKLNLDSLLSVTQLPPGMPVAAVGLDRGDNAALLAARILALKDNALAKRLEAWRVKQEQKVVEDSKKVEVSA
jgi:5-(carboxyamino)imidazole ribonucleotide mutase